MRSNLGNLVSSLKRLTREIGWFDAFLYSIRRLLGFLSPGIKLYHYQFVAQPISDKQIFPARGSAFTIRRIDKMEYQAEWFPRPIAVIHQRYLQGAHCIVAFHGENAIGCLWYIIGPYLEDEVRSQFITQPESSTAWDFDVYIHPKYRLGRTFLYLWSAAWKQLEEKGIRWTMSRIDRFNPGSLRSHEKLGARKIGSAIYIVFLDKQLTLSNIPPYMHFSRNKGSIPRLHMKSPKETGENP